jgi:hypothetical protein
MSIPLDSGDSGTLITVPVPLRPSDYGRAGNGSSGDIELNWLDSRDEFGGHGDFRRQASTTGLRPPGLAAYRARGLEP